MEDLTKTSSVLDPEIAALEHKLQKTLGKEPKEKEVEH
jgi:hypothetical protein